MKMPGFFCALTVPPVTSPLSTLTQFTGYLGSLYKRVLHCGFAIRLSVARQHLRRMSSGRGPEHGQHITTLIFVPATSMVSRSFFCAKTMTSTAGVHPLRCGFSRPPIRHCSKCRVLCFSSGSGQHFSVFCHTLLGIHLRSPTDRFSTQQIDVLEFDY